MLFITSMKRYFLPGLLVTLIILEIVVLSPTSVELEKTNIPTDPSRFVEEAKNTLAKGIPQSKIPEYTVDQFHFISTQAGEKQWKIIAKKADFYNAEKIVHAFQIQANLYNLDGTITTITGLEAKYYTHKRELEIYGNVHSQFPDGFETQSEFLRYFPQSRKIEMPREYPVAGESHESEDQDIYFVSNGLDYSMENAEIFLPENVKFKVIKKPTPQQKKPEITHIKSDQCKILRTDHKAYFRMKPSRPNPTRFVEINQEGLYIKGRRVDLNYGNFSKILQTLIAYEDVFIQETKKEKRLRYSTGGVADYDTNQNIIILKEFPQVYQNNDTVTGDIIVIHRDTDIVEVEHSNAYSEGNEPD